jgi:hypothetical protein
MSYNYFNNMTYFLEYNQKQNQFHIVEVQKSMTNNLMSIINGDDNSWLVVGISGDMKKLYELSEYLTKKYGIGKLLQVDDLD